VKPFHIECQLRQTAGTEVSAEFDTFPETLAWIDDRLRENPKRILKLVAAGRVTAKNGAGSRCKRGDFRTVVVRLRPAACPGGSCQALLSDPPFNINGLQRPGPASPPARILPGRQGHIAFKKGRRPLSFAPGQMQAMPASPAKNLQLNAKKLFYL
jgi:hypothetical protein